MTRRRIVIVGLALVLLAAAYFVLTWRPGAAAPRNLKVENFSRVEYGMTQAEVEELLGGPPGNYGAHAGGGNLMTMEGYVHPNDAVERVWCDDSHRFEIYFDAGGRVVGIHRRASYKQFPGESLWDSIRRSFR